MSLEDRDWYRAEVKRRSRPAVGVWPRRGRWSWRSWLANRLTIWLGVLIVVIAAPVVDRMMDERRAAGPDLPNVIVPSQSRPPRNCTEARSWGLQNIPRNSPHYAPWLDADDDGLACEPWPRR
jgi:hypothetical protein